MIGIIFDCDGTLIDSEHAHGKTWQEALQQQGAQTTLAESASYAGFSGIHIAEQFQKKYQLDSAEALLEDKHRFFKTLLMQGLPPIERTVRFVRQLAAQKKERGIKLAVASAANKDEILIHLEHLGILDLFEAIVSGKDDLDHYHDPEGVNKPKPYIYQHTAKLLGIDPSRCVAFEDSGPGVLSAVRAGMITFAVPHAYTQSHNFSGAVRIVDSATPLDVEEFFAFLKNYKI